MKAIESIDLEAGIFKDKEVFDLPSKFFQDNISNLSIEETQTLVNLLNKYYAKSKAQEESFDYMQHQYQVAQRKYVDLFYFSPTGYFILDREGGILESNLTATNLLGFPNSSISGKNLSTFLAEADKEVFFDHYSQLFEGKRKNVCEVRFRNKNQRLVTVCLESILWPDEYGQLTRIRTAVIDISEKKELENNIRKSAKMDAVDSLVNTIAHDFNNILHSIISNTEYLVHDDSHSNDNVHLNRILDLSSRAADSIAQLIDIGSQSASQQKLIEAGRFIREHKTALEKFVPSAIDVDWRLQNEPFFTYVDPEQLQFILINLFVNSVNAMTSGGSITVDLFKHNPDHSIVKLPQLKEENWLVLRVTDTGQGIHPERVKTLFEPEFDVQPNSMKKGLSLPQVKGIMHQHNGHIHVESRVGVGTAVYLYLPIVQSEEVDSELPNEDTPLVDGKGKTILLVDDEIEVGESFKEILEYLGFKVMMAINGQDGLDIYNEQGKDIQLIITDLVMPEMDGKTFIQSVQKIDSETKIIAISGYPLAQKINELHQNGIAAFVQKPFTIKKMSDVIKGVLQLEPIIA